MMRKSVQQIRAAAYRFFRRLLFILPTAVLIGLLVAFFLWSLDALTVLRFAYPWLLYLLPAAGLLIHFIYQGVGRSSEKGNDLIIGEIARENGKIPARMAPVILATTLITHLFGGSAGREGTAVQIGGSIASFISKVLHVPKEDIRVLLIAGMAAGFGAVFGTPLAGAVFAVEVLAIGRIEYRAFLPALAAAVLGDLTVRFCRVAHTQYTIGHVESGSWFFGGHFHADAFLLIKVVPAAILFGLTAIIFARSVQLVKTGMLKLFKHKWL
ncbi:MAG: chloride channel protein, partial [Mucilaginibacter polytrichastri]|nr:chloride channel protein [Mucilaginibacter polytrichastri]